MSEFVEYLHEVFIDFGPIRSRKMFGGKSNVALFTELDLQPFEFQTKDKIIKMSYYRAPEDIYDDPETAANWANSAFDAALRANSKKNKAKRSKKK